MAPSWNTRTGRHRYGTRCTVLDSKEVQETYETHHHREDCEREKR